MGGAKEGCVMEYHVKGCDIVCAAKVRRCVECLGGSDECNWTDKTGGGSWYSQKKVH